MTFARPFGLSRAFLFSAALVLAGGALAPLPASAEKMTGNDQPAEFPPSSYSGRQYVDSQGCVFVRAGLAGAVTWVPRVSRSRKKLCGFAPSRTQGTAASTAPVVSEPQIRAAPVVANARRAAPAPVAAPVHPAPVRRVVSATPPAPRIAAQRSTAAANSLTAPAVAPVRTPKGYRKAWNDDRLNPNRGKQLLSGALQTALIWTQTVPRHLIDRTSGKDVTATYNYLVYPYTDYARQKRDLRAGTHVVVKNAGGQRFIVLKSRLRSDANGRTVLQKATLSTKSVAPAPVARTVPAQVAPRAQSGRYVQVGTFGVAANAQRTAARLQGAGLPVRLGHVKRGGKTLQIVMAGPFADAAQMNGALATVRRAGFRDAFVR